MTDRKEAPQMTNSITTSNPSNINDRDDSNRKASYVGGVASPAVWYWSAKRGDKAMVRRLGLSAKDLIRLAGLRVNSSNKLAAVCFVGDCYYEVSLCRAELMAV